MAFACVCHVAVANGVRMGGGGWRGPKGGCGGVGMWDDVGDITA